MTVIVSAATNSGGAGLPGHALLAIRRQQTWIASVSPDGSVNRNGKICRFAGPLWDWLHFRADRH